MSERMGTSNAVDIRLASTPDEIKSSFNVMAQLRPHLQEAMYVAQVQRQQRGGYLLACLWEEGQVKAVAGFRGAENLSRGKHVYVDDLVTDAAERSKGYGALLFNWLAAYARRAGCTWLELDSGVQRRGAHRFYFARGMHISSFRFLLELDQSGEE